MLVDIYRFEVDIKPRNIVDQTRYFTAQRLDVMFVIEHELGQGEIVGNEGELAL